ncbi:TlpA family protein disulfide reductase [Psychroserpens algicola]|uniref:TlpA family protein disulfide reductase n=1 Tax=Psychroserpens algicola TaxID=1719034 RepID=A0ABT0HB41_9FLAO|nr:TlpA disulfide reductase family protein [Psychroserpens algicola]MCK8481562.1 TlpA family protein disulfide reductase [Psychroserpens algicola]
MNLYKRLLILICFGISSFSYGQIRFSETIQTSKTATNTEASLFFIDFWATWCKPCVYASEYLGVLQKQYPDRFYVVSLSEENPDVVKRFLKKHPTDLAVSIDYKGETFKANNTRTLPYGLLINANGTVLWKGSPTDFKKTDLERYLRQNTKIKEVNKVLKVQKIKEEVFKADYMPSDDFEIKQLKNETFETLVSSSRGDYIVYKGDLKSIIAKEKKILQSQVQIAPTLNKTYEVYIKKGSNGLFPILEELKLDIFHSEIQGEVLMLDISNMIYWDTHQIDWGENTAEYLIDDTQIQADNVTFEDVMFQLASVLNLPIATKGAEADLDKHDWQIHHRFYNLMQTNLEDAYGIKATKEKGRFKTYMIRKKTP